MKFTALLAPFALIGTVLAGDNTIVGALTTVDGTTTKLGTAVARWKGDLLGTLPIVAESTALLVQVNKGTKTAKDSAALDFAGTIDVATATNKLVVSVNTTMTALIGARKKFDKLLLTPVILIDLGLQRRATSEMSAAIIAKVPADLQALAKNLVAPIDASFALAIAAFR